MHSSIAPASASSSDSSMLPGTTAASSTTARAAGLSASTRSATASRTLAGHADPGRRGQRLGDEERVAARDGVQLGRVVAGARGEQRDRVAARAPPARSAARSCAAARRARAAPRAARRCGWSGSGSPASAPAGGRAARRGRASRRRPSAGPRRRAPRSRRARRAPPSGRPRASRRPRAPRASARRAPAATSRSGPIGRGVISGSHAPQSTRRSRRSASVTDGHERGLADPRLADHGHDATGLAGLRYRRFEDLAFAFTFKKLQRAEPNRRR